MSITSSHVANFKLRLQLLIWSLIIGAASGGWIGHQIVRSEMRPQESQAFDQYLIGRAKEIAGLNMQIGQTSRDRHINFVHELRSTQEGYWAQKFEASAQLAYVLFPFAGAVALAILLMLVGRRIGGVDERSPS